jgi:biopolymer transport protein ExbD
MAGINTESGGGKRQVNQDVNMIPFIDLLMVTIAFLLITAVWVSYSRIEANAQLPSNERGPTTDAPTKDLHLYMEDDEFVLTWKQAGVVVSEKRLPRAAVQTRDGFRYDDLAKAIAAEWKQHGGHVDASDRAVDRCVFHSANDVPFSDIVAVMDAIYSAKREMTFPDGSRQQVPVFAMGFASN